MTARRKPIDDNAAIEALLTRVMKAHADRDAAAVVEAYAPDAVIYDLAPPLGRRGLKRDEIAAWLATWDGPVTLDCRELEITVDGDLAFSTALNRMRGSQGGEPQDLWFRTTTCFRRTNGGWRIVHDHTSVPFYMDGSYRAAIDLKPSR